MIEYKALKDKFHEFYGREPRIFRAPGRVNLIGEHTDYNGGFVLPMAIDREAAMAISERKDRKIRVHTANFGETAEFDLDEEKPLQKGFWLNYIEGVARILERNSVKLKGADILLMSDVPTGAGLSSSAALEVVSGLALSEISGFSVDRKLLAKIGQQTEHEFVGALVGIMDQFVSANAEKEHALLLDCRSLAFENVPLDTSETAVLICDTKVKHDLATSGYNTRRAECEEAVRILKRFLPEIEQLRDVTVEDFEKYKNELPDVVQRRAKHIITENARTLKAGEVLKKNDLKEFGRLMYESHESMKNDYEISCAELDILVEIARNKEGVLGARMTGGGFGGSTVNLVKKENLAQIIEEISAEYEQKTDIAPTTLVSEACGGASEIKLAEM